MKKVWIREFARDILALGSIPFFILVLARVLMLKNSSYLFQLFIGGILVLILCYFFKFDFRPGMGVVIGFFLTIYYSEFIFGVFAVIALILLVWSSGYLRENYWNAFFSFWMGVISALVSSFVVGIVF